MEKRSYEIAMSNHNNEIFIYRRKIIILSAIQLLSSQRNKKRWHVRPVYQGRKMHGYYHCFAAEHQLCNSALYYNFVRMSPTSFEELVQLVGPELYRSPTRPDILAVGEILLCTLRFLASGDSLKDMSYGFRIAQPTISVFIPQCCNAIWNILHDKVLSKPNKDNWKFISKDFYKKWNFPNCCGSMDGKHIVHQAFSNSGSTNYNYKGAHSIVLLAICDASYCFTLVDIGAPGRSSDGGVFRNSNWGKLIIDQSIDFPEPEHIDGENGLVPFCLVADEAFPLLPNLMRPYPGRGKANLPEDQTVFNYRLSRARRTIENTFGIMASKWRIFRSPIIGSEETVIAITKAAVVLHNFVRISEKVSGENEYCSSALVDRYDNGQFIPGQWRNGYIADAFTPLRQTGSNFYSAQAKVVREKFKKYFNSSGSIHFQHYRNY